MIIKRIEIKNFRKLTGPVVIDRLKPGINVIAGDNEEGKSTVFTALRCCFFLRHTTTGTLVENLVPYGSNVRPEVTVDFDLPAGSYSLTKTFYSKPFTARLRTPSGVYEGASVEEHLQQLLLYPASTAKKSGEQDRGFWGLLWLEQAAAISGLAMSDYGRQTILKAVESDVGTVLGGKNGRALMAAVSRLYSEHFTAAQGHPTKDYRKAKESLEIVLRELDICKATSRDYERAVDDLTQKRDEMAKMKRDNLVVLAETRAKSALAQSEKLKQAQQEIDNCVQMEKTQRAECDSLKHKWDARVQLRADFEKYSKELHASHQAAEQSIIELAETETRKDKAQSDLDMLQKQRLEGEKARVELQHKERIQRIGSEKNALTKRLTDAKSTLIKLENTRQIYASLKVEDKALLQLRKLERDAADANTKVHAASTRIVVHPLPGQTVSAGNRPLEQGNTELLSEPTTLELSSWGTIEIHPGGEDVPSKRLRAEETNARFQEALRRGGVANIAEAEEQALRKQQIRVDGELLKSELNMLAPDGIEALEAAILKAEKELNSSNFPDINVNVGEELAKINATMEHLRKQEAAELSNTNSLTKLVQTANAQMNQWHGKVSMLQEQVNNLQARIERLLAEESDESLKLRLDEALHKCSVREAETMLARTKFDSMNPSSIRTELEEAEKLLRAVRSQWENLERNVELLAVKVETLAEQSPGERLQECEGKAAKAQQQFESMERKANAIKLLFETMRDAEQEAKDQIMEPVQLRLRPYLKDVFPDADVSLDRSQFEIEGLQRKSFNEKYTSLSVGTREQISVLTRLAIAGLLKEKGYPATVILDDALVYSDDRRFELMKGVLSRAAEERNMQIIILTCRKRDYVDFDHSLIDLAQCSLDPSGTTR